MKVTIIPTMTGAFGIVTKVLIKGLEDLEVGGPVETIQTTALLRTARILRRAWKLEETCCHSNSIKKPSAKANLKNYQWVNNQNYQWVNNPIYQPLRSGKVNF